MRSQPVGEVLKFTELEDDGRVEPIENTNSLEIDALVANLKGVCANPSDSRSIGIITPHTNQQKLLLSKIQRLDEAEDLFNRHKLKIMTFDICQGEERDIIMYSMVANQSSDKLNYIFTSSLANIDLDDEGKIKAQRLNVGFSRAKEQIHIFHSKPLEDFTGEIGKALRFYKRVLTESKDLPTLEDVDPNSPMEKKVLNWILETPFFKANQDKIHLTAQFPVGDYLKQLDPFYSHPSYVVDFLFTFKDESRELKVIIEYDGFREHFTNLNDVNEFNYEHYYKENDVVREKTLESYGYKFLRINRFNAGTDPIETLDTRLKMVVEKDGKKRSSNVIQYVSSVISGVENGEMKQCPSCNKFHPLSKFKDASLITGIGRICENCKVSNKKRTPSKRRRRKLAKDSKNASRLAGSSEPCPKCSSNMVLRGGRYGEFFGCSRFPRCKGTRSAA